MIFHKSGPQAGQARGYAFVTYVDVSVIEKKTVLLSNHDI